MAAKLLLGGRLALRARVGVVGAPAASQVGVSAEHDAVAYGTAAESPSLSVRIRVMRPGKHRKQRATGTSDDAGERAGQALEAPHDQQDPQEVHGVGASASRGISASAARTDG